MKRLPIDRELFATVKTKVEAGEPLLMHEFHWACRCISFYRCELGISDKALLARLEARLAEEVTKALLR